MGSGSQPAVVKVDPEAEAERIAAEAAASANASAATRRRSRSASALMVSRTAAASPRDVPGGALGYGKTVLGG